MSQLTARARMLSACRCEPVDRPPVWFMRQAGRYLPEYRALKQRHGFHEMIRTPELAAEVTAQPLRRFPLDAAIIFSDILVVPEALGLGYRFRDEGGIAMEWELARVADLDRLDRTAAAERVGFAKDCLAAARREVGEGTALLGFCGAPWTLAVYMAGGPQSHGGRLKQWYHADRNSYERLMQILTATCVALLQAQIAGGADAVMIFDSWAGLCPGNHYGELSLRWIGEIRRALPEEVPVITYVRGTLPSLRALTRLGIDAFSADFTLDLPSLAETAPRDLALQGNLDPALLEGPAEVAAREARGLLDAMSRRHGYILNVGHGLRPLASMASVAAVSESVANYARQP